MTLALLNKRSPFGTDVGRLRDEFDRAIDRMFNEPLSLLEPRPARSAGWIPPIDVSETETEVAVRAELPGIPVKDVEISVVEGALTISGDKAEHFEKKGENYFLTERRFGSFRRILPLPDTIDLDKVTAECENGVLLIRLAKKPGAKPKTVEIKPVSRKVPVT